MFERDVELEYAVRYLLNRYQGFAQCRDKRSAPKCEKQKGRRNDKSTGKQQRLMILRVFLRK